MGGHEQTIALQAVRMGAPIPDRIANAPELEIGLDLYINAFFELDTERTHIYGATPIPFTSIMDYAIAFGFDEEQREDLLFYIRQMDAANLKRIDAKIKAKQKK